MTDRIIFVCTLLLAGVYFWATAQIPSLDLGDPLGPKAFPRLLGAGLLIAAGMLLLEMLRKRRGGGGDNDAAAGPAADGAPGWQPHHWVTVAVTGWTALFIAAFEPAGFILATSVYLLGLMAYFNRNRWRMNVLTALLFSVISYFSFTRLLGVTLAPGILPF